MILNRKWSIKERSITGSMKGEKSSVIAFKKEHLSEIETDQTYLHSSIWWNTVLHQAAARPPLFMTGEKEST